MRNSPAQIIRELLLAESGALPTYVGSTPDGPGIQDEIFTVYDTTGITLHRLMASGYNENVYGIQVRVRYFDYQEAYSKMSAVADNFEVLHNFVVSVGGNQYTVDSIMQTGPIMSLGQDDKRRVSLVLNFLVGFIGN